MNIYDERCQKCPLFKQYGNRFINNHKDEVDPYENQNGDPKKRRNYYSVSEDVLHSILSPISQMLNICCKCSDCKGINNCKEQCCLADRETEKMLFNNCRYSLHRLQICMDKCDEDRKEIIKNKANEIIQFLQGYSCHCNYEWRYFGRKILTLKEQYKELLSDDKENIKQNLDNY